MEIYVRVHWMLQLRRRQTRTLDFGLPKLYNISHNSYLFVYPQKKKKKLLSLLVGCFSILWEYTYIANNEIKPFLFGGFYLFIYFYISQFDKNTNFTFLFINFCKIKFPLSSILKRKKENVIKWLIWDFFYI